MARALLLLLASLAAAPAQPVRPQWKLVWHDEFKGRANSRPNPANWDYDLGAGEWGTGEIEAYTDSAANAFLDGRGNLVIRVLKSPGGGYTSARLKTLGRFQFLYGKVEARLRLPYGQGIWPAFWMLAANRTTVGWRNSGEIDIMENIGREPATVHATAHGPGYSGEQGIGATSALADPRAFHTYGLVWRPDSIEFLVDGATAKKVTPADLPSKAPWVFDTPFYLLLNVAVGGGWPGPPDATSTYPQSMLVDYVRVYQLKASKSFKISR